MQNNKFSGGTQGAHGYSLMLTDTRGFWYSNDQVVQVGGIAMLGHVAVLKKPLCAELLPGSYAGFIYIA
jgi:hypothetical protein